MVASLTTTLGPAIFCQHFDESFAVHGGYYNHHIQFRGVFRFPVDSYASPTLSLLMARRAAPWTAAITKGIVRCPRQDSIDAPQKPHSI
jgi:hypothetical protein